MMRSTGQHEATVWRDRAGEQLKETINLPWGDWMRDTGEEERKESERIGRKQTKKDRRMIIWEELLFIQPIQTKTDKMFYLFKRLKLSDINTLYKFKVFALTIYCSKCTLTHAHTFDLHARQFHEKPQQLDFHTRPAALVQYVQLCRFSTAQIF